MEDSGGIEVYQKQQVETGSLGQLIVMLYDAAMSNSRAPQDAIDRQGRERTHATYSRRRIS